MSNENNPQPPVTQPPSVARDIRAAVKEGLIDANTKVKASIVLSYVQEELAKRVKAMTTVLEKVDATELEIRKIKPTAPGFNVDGAPAGEPVYSKDQVDTLKKAKEQLGKLNGALEKALTDNDFTRVFELAGNK